MHEGYVAVLNVVYILKQWFDLIRTSTILVGYLEFTFLPFADTDVQE